MARNLDFAVGRGGQPLTLGGITGNAVASSSDRTESTDDIGAMMGANISATIPITTWPTEPTVGAMFSTGGRAYRIVSVGKVHSGHAWIITGKDQAQ